MWKIVNIFEDDYGCEELQLGERVKVLVELENEEGTKRMVRAYDEYLTWNRLDVGSNWHDTDEKDRALGDQIRILTLKRDHLNN